jgi:AhpD family alkylhydroperoxidase
MSTEEMTMSNRLQLNSPPFKAAYQAMLGLSAAVRSTGLEPALLELVRTRVSQLNGCGFCIDMHTKDARAAGETEQRLYLLNAWREAPLYSERERAALAWAEAVTRLDQQHVADAIYEQARSAFGEEELAALTLAIVEINGWNRFAIAFQAVPGSYQPRTRQAGVHS